MSDILYIIMPAYNEKENIANVITSWYPIVERHDGNGKSRLVVIDDGSTDGTYEIIEQMRGGRELLKGIKKKNSGHGATLLFGYKHALKYRADYIFQTDSDGQTLPDEFELFWNERENYDMVIGWRKGRQDGKTRVMVTKTLRAVIRLCFGVDVLDANTPYRIMNAKTLEDAVKLIPKDYNLTNVIVSVIFIRKNRKVKYIPITFRQRQGGINYINIRRIIGIGNMAVRDFIKINRRL